MRIGEAGQRAQLSAQRLGRSEGLMQRMAAVIERASFHVLFSLALLFFFCFFFKREFVMHVTHQLS